MQLKIVPVAILTVCSYKRLVTDTHINTVHATTYPQPPEHTCTLRLIFWHIIASIWTSSHR